MKQIKIFLADDHKILRESLRMLLDREDDFQVVGEAEDGLSVAGNLKGLEADVVLLDVSMQGMRNVD